MSKKISYRITATSKNQKATDTVLKKLQAAYEAILRSEGVFNNITGKEVPIAAIIYGHDECIYAAVPMDGYYELRPVEVVTGRIIVHLVYDRCCGLCGLAKDSIAAFENSRLACYWLERSEEDQ